MKQLVKLIAIMLVIASCRSVNKSKTEIHKKNDSTSVNASNSSTYSAFDSATEKGNNNNSSSFAYSDSSGELSIYFSENDGYCGDTAKNRNSDRNSDSNSDSNSDKNTANTGKPGPIRINNDGRGTITIDAGGRSVKGIKQNTKTTAIQSQTINKDSSSITKVSTIHSNETKKSDSTRVVSSEEAKQFNKETTSFNWLWVVLVVALLATGIYVIRKKINFFTSEES